MNVLSRQSGPAVLPVTIEECKRDLRILDSDQDVYLNELIVAAVDYLDGHNGVLGHAMITQTWRLTLKRFYDTVRLPFAPVQSVSAITYYDGDNAEQSLDVASFTLAGATDYAWLERVPTVTLPGTYDRPDAVRVDFVAGYGDTASDVPAGIRRAIRMLVAHWFEHPTPQMVGASMAHVPLHFEHVIGAYRRQVVW